MTKLEEVLAEEWRTTVGAGPIVGGCAQIDFGYGDHITLGAFRPEGTLRPVPRDHVRAAVAVLGHRALALVLKHEWSNVQEETGVIACPECSGYKPGTELGPTGHTPGCTWGAICEEARRLG